MACRAEARSCHLPRMNPRSHSESGTLLCTHCPERGRQVRESHPAENATSSTLILPNYLKSSNTVSTPSGSHRKTLTQLLTSCHCLPQWDTIHRRAIHGLRYVGTEDECYAVPSCVGNSSLIRMRGLLPGIRNRVQTLPLPKSLRLVEEEWIAKLLAKYVLNVFHIYIFESVEMYLHPALRPQLP